MGWWLVAMLSWLAGVGVQVCQADMASRFAMWSVGTVSALGLVVAVVGLNSHHARFRQWSRLGWLALAGLAWATTTWRSAERLGEHLPLNLESHKGAQVVQARVQIDSLVRAVPGAYLFDAKVLAYQGPDDRSWLAPDRMPSAHWPEVVAVRLNAAASSANDMRPSPGQQWQMTLRVHEPDGLSNPGGQDAELSYWERGVRAVGQVRAGQAHLVSPNPEWFWQGWVDRVRGDIRDRIAKQVPQTRAAGVLAGLAVGDQGSIDQQDWEVFRLTGVSHLIAVSGGHIAMLGWLAACLIRPLWLRTGKLAWRVPSPVAARIGAVVVATLYAVLSGWGVPAQRTVMMMAVFGLLRISGRQWPWPMVWLLAAVVVTVFDPWAFLQAGFWLSFVAVGILMSSADDEHLSHSAKTAKPGLLESYIWQPARQMWSTQWRVTLGLAPLSLVFFQQTSLIGLPANLWAIPVFTLAITPLALLAALFAPFWSLGAWCVDWTVQLLASLAQSPMAVLQVPALPLWAAAAAVGAGAALIWPMRWRWRLMLLPFFLPLIWLPSVWQTWPVPRPGQFAVVAADVGQGSAILVRTTGHALLFDTGPKVGQSSDAGAKVVVPLLRSLGVNQLDVVMVSHADMDHIGGAQSIYKALAVSQLWSPLSPDHVLRQTPSADGHVPLHHDCLAGQSWVWDDVRFTVLHPSAADLAERDRLPDNALSCVLQIKSSDGSTDHVQTRGRIALLTGDVEGEQERALVDTWGVDVLRADLLLVPHHGSKTSSTQGFLDAVQPSQSVIQVGRRNRYGHPAPSVLTRYRAMHLPFVASPDCGAFLWRSDAADVSGQCWRNTHRHYWQPRISDDESGPEL